MADRQRDLEEETDENDEFARLSHNHSHATGNDSLDDDDSFILLGIERTVSKSG